MPRMLDICSGLGGASEAFYKHGWEIVRIDNNAIFSDPKNDYYVPRTICQDILEWDHTELPKDYLNFVWASPPCLQFSDAIDSPARRAKRENRPFTPDRQIIYKIKKIVDYFDAPWCVENVRGSRKEFTKVFGPPWQIMMPFFLYGKFPRVNEIQHTKHSVDVSSSHPLRANIRGKIPYELSLNFLKALMYQKTLRDF